MAFLTISLPTPEGLSIEAHRTIAYLLLMGAWWAASCSRGCTALVPLALFPLLGIVDIQSAANPMRIKSISSLEDF